MLNSFFWVSFLSIQFLVLNKERLPDKSPPHKPKNIIILIGDGMGVSQMTSAYYYNEKDQIPNFSRLTTVGLITTSSCSEKITDSAAGATAIACGKKTDNTKIGLDAQNNRIENLPEYLAKLNMSNGLVSTSSITHATPAAFYAHERSRHNQYEIAEQMIDAPINYFAGGGYKYFTQRSNKSLYADMMAKGFKLDTTSLKDISGEKEGNKYGFLLAPNELPKMLEGRGSFLKEATTIGINFLKNDKDGFFMMVEGSQIDWGGHANNAQYVISEVLDFDEAVGAAMDFAERDSTTLVIVTADHETGGFTLSAGSKSIPFMGEKPDYNKIEPSFSTGGHSAAMVPVLAFGPGSELFGGIYPNTEIHARILKLMEE